MYHNFIGIDISKNDFVTAYHGSLTTHIFENTPDGFIAFYKEYKSLLTDAFVVLETTGGYEMELTTFLIGYKNLTVHRADTRKAKYFIKSLGQSAKTDAIDAQGLARYGYERHKALEPFKLKDTLSLQLQNLAYRRLDLNKMLVQEKNRSQAPGAKYIKVHCLKLIEVLQEQIQAVDHAIDSLLMLDQSLKARQKALETIPGIGPITSRLLVTLLPELGATTRQKIASLVGLAPYPQESGLKIGYRRTKGGRRHIRPILFMAAMSAMKTKSPLGDFYRRLIAKGKKKMVAMTALMRKILVIANARLAQI